MTCRDVIDFLMMYLDGDLTETQRGIFDDHLTRCAACLAYLKLYHQTIQLEKDAFREPDEATLESVPEELIQAILAAHTTGR